VKVIDVSYGHRIFTLEINEINLRLMAVACGITSANEREHGYKRVFGVEMPSHIRDVNYIDSPYNDIMDILEKEDVDESY